MNKVLPFLLLLVILQVISCSYHVPRPIKLAYINTINSWWPLSSIAGGMGVPGYSNQNVYNYIVLAFWNCGNQIYDIVKVWDKPVQYIGSSFFETTDNNEARKQLKEKYNKGGVKIMISAFGGTAHPTSEGKDPLVCAKQLGDYVLSHDLDGVDLDYEDNDAMWAGTGANWIIAFTKSLRKQLPNHIITHAPQAPYFHPIKYGSESYIKVHKEVGSMIDFYNIQFYNQGNTQYSTYEGLFIHSQGYFSGTAVTEIIANGVQSEKIIVGKPASPADAANTGYIDSSLLGSFVAKANKELGWSAGVMFWQYKNDNNGLKMAQACEALLVDSSTSSTDTTQPDATTPTVDQTTPVDQTTLPPTDQTNQSTDVPPEDTTPVSPNPDEQTNIPTQNTALDTTATQSQSQSIPLTTNLPILLSYILNIKKFYPDQSILSEFLIPGYSQTPHNLISLSLWTKSYGVYDALAYWTNFKGYLTTNTLGSTNSQIQQNIVKRYHEKGKKVIVSAFGSTEVPTIMGLDPIKTAQQLASFIVNNYLDGVDVRYMDTGAFYIGSAQQWLIIFTTQLRRLLPTHLIIHSVSNKYFKPNFYMNGGYSKVNEKVGNKIDFYAIEYYHDSTNYQNLFIQSGASDPGTSVLQISKNCNIPLHKMIVSKPGSQILGGFISSTDLKTYASKASKDINWRAGFGVYESNNDKISQNLSDLRTILQ